MLVRHCGGDGWRGGGGGVENTGEGELGDLMCSHCYGGDVEGAGGGVGIGGGGQGGVVDVARERCERVGEGELMNEQVDAVGEVVAAVGHCRGWEVGADGRWDSVRCAENGRAEGCTKGGVCSVRFM